MASGTGWASARRRATGAHALLLAVCLLHLLLIAVFVISHHVWWEQDETVYLSQVASHTPALRFTPPRARGMPVLLFPVVHFTTRLSVVRGYVAVLGTLAMYVGFRPWLRLGLGRLVALAALLFTTLWAATFFGAETQPNFLIATLSAAAVGYTLAALREPERRLRFLPALAAVALAALIRPADATWLCAALLLALAAMRRVAIRERLAASGALVAGLILGWSEWVIEAYVSYGGFFHRLHEANAANTPGLHFSLLTQAGAVNGPTLCRPCSQPVAVSHIAWWIAVPPLVALALVAARGTRRFVPLAVATAAGAAMLAEYVVTVSYAAPRFLLPAYALLSLPTAAGLAALWTLVARRSVGRARPAVAFGVAAVAAVALVAQVGSQTHYLQHLSDHYAKTRQQYLAEAAELHRAGVRPPCVMNGPYATPVAFKLRCNDHPNVQEGVLSRVGQGVTIVEFAPPGTPDYPGARRLRLPHRGPAGAREVAYVLGAHGRTR